MMMLLGYLLQAVQLAGLFLWWATPFTFVFCLVYAIKEAVTGGERTFQLSLGAAVSLLLIAASCMNIS
ncbi:MAG: hypothetical protein HFF18_12100 [Oscillospiraceae bacterium]|nr:hypothetical protein [Oscillospiraceae bacterium]